MAITRIKNNQITDSTITNAKIASGTITGGSLNPDLNYSGNLTVTGNLSVSGTTTVVDTVNTTIADPLLLLSRNASGAPTVDAGFVVERGSSTNVAFVWDESAGEFIAASTSEDGTTAGAITITAYSNLKVNVAKMDTLANQAGSASPKIAGLTATRVTFAGTDGVLNDNAGLTFAAGTLSVADVDISGSTVESTSGALTLGGFNGTVTTASDVEVTSATGSSSTSSGALTVTGGVGINENLYVGGDADVAGDAYVTGSVDVTNDISAVNAVLSGDIDALTGSIATLDGVDASFTGNVTAGGDIDATGDMSATNAVFSGDVDAATGTITTLDGTTATFTTGNITTVNATTLNGTSAALSAGLTVGTTAAITGNLTAGNISATTGVLTTGNITTVNATTLNGTNAVLSGDIDAATGTIDTLDGTDASFTGNVTAGSDIDATGDMSATNAVFSGDVSAVDGTFSGDVIVSGNLTVDGTATYVNTVTTTVADPIMLIGGGDDGAAPAADDNKDRGIGFQWHDGDAAKNGFFGFDDSTGRFTFVPVATISSEVVSGTKGDIDVNEVFAVDGTFSGAVSADSISVTTLNSTNLGLSGNLTVGGTAGFTGAMTGSDLTLSGDIDALTGTIDTLDGVDATFSGNVQASGTGSFTGNVSVGNLTTNGDIDAATGTIDTLSGVDASFSGNLTVSGDADVTGDLTAGNISTVGDIDAVTGTIATLDGTDASFTGNISAAGDVDALTGTIVTLDGTTATFTTGNLTTVNATSINASGTIDSTSTDASTTTSSGAIITAGGVGIAGNINVGGAKSQFTNTTASTSKTTGAVVVAGGVGVGGALSVGNIQVDTQTISSLNTDGAINIQPNGTGKTIINGSGNGSDTAIGGVNNANVIYVDASGDNVGIKTASPHANASLHINGTDSFIIPTGTTAQRPGTTQTGMVRFNSDTSAIEYYDSTEWTSLASDFTVIASQSFSGDESTVAFTLTESQTTASCIVSINGIVQAPGDAYSVSGTTLTFTEAPGSADTIEVRKITTTTTVTNISDSVNGYAAMFAVPAGIELYAGSAARTKYVTIDNNGQLYCLATTVSSSTSTGALVVDGGVGIAGNLFVGGNITAAGNITFGDNASDTVDFTAAIASHVLPSVDVTYDLGSASKRWRDIYLSGSTITLGTVVIKDNGGSVAFYGADGTTPASVGVAAGSIGAAELASNAVTTVKITDANVTTAKIADSNVTTGKIADGAVTNAKIAADAVTLGTQTTGSYVAVGAVSGNGLTGSASSEGATFTVTSNATSANTANTIVYRDASGNFSAGTITATTTSAQYADLAENYVGDAAIEPGTVVEFGGDKEVTACAHDMCTRVAGVVSTNPAYLMNVGLEAEHVVAVAFTGRVPCKVVGPVRKGDMMVSAGNGAARAEADPKVGSIIGKALENFDGAEGVIEVVVGRY